MKIFGKINLYIRSSLYYLPIITCLVAILLLVCLKPPTGFGISLPMLVVICVYYWSVYNNKVFSEYQIFLVGLLSDIFFGNPLGSGPLLMLLLRFVALRVSSVIKPSTFIIGWFLASLVFLIFIIINWIFLYLYYMKFPSVENFILQFLLTISIYPAMSIILGWVSNMMNKYRVPNV